MVKALAVGVSLLSVFGYFFMQPRNVTVAELSVAEGISATAVIESTVANEPPTKKLTVVATAYCACESCCGKSDGITASGVKARANHTIAVDRSVIPLGTHILYNGTEYVAEDTGGAIKGNRIDIYFDSHEDALRFGRRTIEIEVIV